MTDNEITPEHVQEAARLLSPEYNFKAGYQRGIDRAYWFFLPAVMWAFALGWTFGGMGTAWHIPWGSYTIAVIFTVISFYMLRKMRK